MWCTNCGQKLIEGARFCDKCGTVLNNPTPAFIQSASPEPKVENQPVAESIKPTQPMLETAAPNPTGGVATRPLTRARLFLPNQQEIDLPFDGSFVLGRGDGVNIVDLDLTEVDTQLFTSRKHAEIRSRFGDYYVKDLGSRNGTYINEKKIGVNEEVKLVDKDKIILGQLELLFINGA